MHFEQHNPPPETPLSIRRGLSEREAAKYLGISSSSLRQGRCDGRRHNHMPPPPFVRLGRKIVYLRDDLDRWLEENRAVTGGEVK